MERLEIGQMIAPAVDRGVEFEVDLIPATDEVHNQLRRDVAALKATDEAVGQTQPVDAAFSLTRTVVQPVLRQV